jgi:hypothetical protein
MILCECGEIIYGCAFKAYIKTSSNPSTATIGHKNCGLIFNFIDGENPRRFSSKAELKSIALRYAEKLKLCHAILGEFLLEVDRLKSLGTLSDVEILILATKTINSIKL